MRSSAFHLLELRLYVKYAHTDSFNIGFCYYHSFILVTLTTLSLRTFVMIHNSGYLDLPILLT